MTRGSRNFDHDSDDGACTACSTLYAKCTLELKDICMDGFTVRVLQERKFDKRQGVCSIGQKNDVKLGCGHTS